MNSDRSLPMWKLIKYELKTRYVQFLAFLLGILVWDFLWIRELNSFGSDFKGVYKIDPSFITMTLIFLVTLVFILFLVLIIITTNQNLRSFKNNCFSFFQTTPIPPIKILVSQLFVIILEVILLFAVQAGILYQQVKSWLCLWRSESGNG